MATTFQIIDCKTKQPVSLNYFDKIFCEQTGTEYSDKEYTMWYPFLETILCIYAELSDNAGDLYIVNALGINPKSREIDFHTVARLYIVVSARSFYRSESFDSFLGTFDLYKTLIEFYHNNKDNYYIEFSL